MTKSARDELLSFLRENRLEYEHISHPPVFTCEEAEEKIKPPLKGISTKNLFLKEKNGGFLLLVTKCGKRLRLKEVAEQLGRKRLEFGDAESLLRLLGVEPGSVTSFGLLFDKNKEVALVIDSEILESECVQLHPMVNSETLILSQEVFRRFFQELGLKIQSNKFSSM